MRIRWLTVFLDFPGEALEEGAAFWREITASGLSPWRGETGEFATLLPPDGDSCLRVQRVNEGNGGCHLDLHLDGSAGRPGDAARRAEALGARIRRLSDDLVIAASPGGFAFCLVGWEGESAVPSPAVSTGAGASRADQLCLDVPPGAFERECAFWAALTGWELRPGARPEFAYLERPEPMPVRILLQRRDEAAAGDPVSGHIDFACSDPESLAERHAAAGAQVLGSFPFWVAMADPTGRCYCLTVRDPATGKLPSPPRQ